MILFSVLYKTEKLFIIFLVASLLKSLSYHLKEIEIDFLKIKTY
jgi:hypothetical protein